MFKCTNSEVCVFSTPKDLKTCPRCGSPLEKAKAKKKDGEEK